jgi:hypothetical protein
MSLHLHHLPQSQAGAGKTAMAGSDKIDDSVPPILDDGKVQERVWPVGAHFIQSRMSCINEAEVPEKKDVAPLFRLKMILYSDFLA